MSDINNLKPLVSIVIPVYNGANFMREAIDSALNQTYTNCEVIVVNDGSNDDGATRNIALSFGERIRYFEKENGGVATALNLGIYSANGEYISWLSHDDLYFPEKVESQISFLNTLPNRNVIIYSDFEILYVELNEVIPRIICHLEPYDYLQDMIILLLNSQLHGCSLLLPKCCFSEVAYFDRRFKTIQDYDMWFKLLRSGYNFVHLPEVVLRTRWHNSQGSIVMKDIQSQEREDVHLWVLEQFFDDIITFPAHVVFDVVTLEGRICKKCEPYIVGRIRNEKPILYWNLLARKAWAYVKESIRACFRPLRPCLIRLGLYHPQYSNANKS